MFKDLTQTQILLILKANKMQGRIESGYRFWLCEFLTLSYYHPLNQDGLMSYLREVGWNIKLSTAPIEKFEVDLDTRLRELAKEMYKKHKENLAVLN